MAANQPQPAGLPTEFAVFPLPGALLLPQGKLPLNIFEPRYLALIEDSLAPPRMFGMIMPGCGPTARRPACIASAAWAASPRSARPMTGATSSP